MTRYLGVDCGFSGALAIVEKLDGVPRLIDVIDMPSTGTGAKARVDIIAAAAWVKKHTPAAAYVERAQAFPGQGASSGFSYGRAAGAIEAVVALCAIPMILVEASAWKRKLKLPGKDKEAARQKALQLFPSQHALLARKKDHGRAEAALIAVAQLDAILFPPLPANDPPVPASLVRESASDRGVTAVAQPQERKP